MHNNFLSSNCELTVREITRQFTASVEVRPISQLSIGYVM